MEAKKIKPHYIGNLFYIDGWRFDKKLSTEILSFTKEHFKYLEITIEEEKPIFKDIFKRKLPIKDYESINEDDTFLFGTVREINTKEKDIFSGPTIDEILKLEYKWRFSGEKRNIFDNGKINTYIVIKESEEGKIIPGTNIKRIEIPFVTRIINICGERNKKEETKFSGIYKAMTIYSFKNQITSENSYSHYVKIKKTP